MTSQPDLRPIKPTSFWRPRYRLETPYVARWKNLDGHNIHVTIPQGFITDGSTEWQALFWCWFLPAGIFYLLGIQSDGPHRAAALLHDYLYRNRQFSRAEADHAMRQLRIAGGEHPIRAGLKHWVIRLIGFFWYH